MNNMRLMLIGAVVLVVVIAGAFLLVNKSTTQTGTENSSPTQSTTAPQNESKEAAISVTANGFEPATLTIKTGTNVVWTNNSGDNTTVNSDNHPTHLRFPFLNLGSFDNGKTASVVFEKAGTYFYHDHLHPERTGTVIVQ